MNEKISTEKQEHGSASRGNFSGRFGYVLAVAGSAVGLGNIWRFPYLAAKYGGGMFLLVYLSYVWLHIVCFRNDSGTDDRKKSCRRL